MLDAMDRRFAPFPNLSTLGSYNFFSQIVRTDGFEAAAFERAFKDRDPAVRLKLVPLLVHELQHFEDHLLSAWGASNLRRLFTAMNGRVSGNMARLNELTAVFREVRDLHLNDYYNELYEGSNQPWDHQTWAYQFSTGVKLDAEGRERLDHPVLFTKFSTRDGTPVCRVPVTVAALLEVRAMAVEVAMQVSLIPALPAEDRLIEENLYPRQLAEMFYDPLMTRYTVIAHYFANIFGIGDIFVALVRAAELAWVVLNLPDDYFDRLRIPPSFAPWGNRNRAAVDRRDRGFAYGLILENMKDVASRDSKMVLDVMLERSGLPDTATIMAAAKTAREQSYADLPDGPYSDRFRDLVAFAARLGDPIDAVEGMTGYRKGVVPSIFTGDGKFLRFAKTGIGGTFSHPGEWVARCNLIHNRFDEFLNACVL